MSNTNSNFTNTMIIIHMAYGESPITTATRVVNCSLYMYSMLYRGKDEREQSHESRDTTDPRNTPEHPARRTPRRGGPAPGERPPSPRGPVLLSSHSLTALRAFAPPRVGFRLSNAPTR